MRRHPDRPSMESAREIAPLRLTSAQSAEIESSRVDC
jgi:hypothetical protein